jgi:hyaluronate lyase
MASMDLQLARNTKDGAYWPKSPMVHRSFLFLRKRSILLYLAFACTFVGMVSSACAQNSPYDALRMRWFDHLTGNGYSAQEDASVSAAIQNFTVKVQLVWQRLQAEQESSSGCFDSVGLEAGATTECFGDLRTMALAYQTNGGTLYHDPQLAKSIIEELNSLYTHSYNEKMSEKGNWWFWEFGIPMPLEDVVVLMHDSLTTEQIDSYMRAIDHFLPSPETSTGGGLGANGAWSAQVCTLKSILLQNTDGKLSHCRDKFNELMQYVNDHDGYYIDGSYVGHTYFAYTGGYGMDFLTSLGNAFILYAVPSPFPLNPQRMQIAAEWVARSYVTLLYRGLLPYYVVGREFGRPRSTDFSRGLAVALACIDLADGLPEAESINVRRFAKTILMNLESYPLPPGGSLYAAMTIAQVRQVEGALTSASVAVLAPDPRSTVFGRMSKVEHGTPTFGFGISMFSTRMQNYEDASENRHGWHQSDGMTYLFNDDVTQYDDGYWPTVDSNRLAGTTVDEDDAIPSNLFNASSFAGGATLAGRYSAIGFVLHPAGDTLTAQKAYFLFDREVVCLGSGIEDTHGAEVETVVENRKLSRTGAPRERWHLTIDGKPYQSEASGRPSVIPKVHWVDLSGPQPGSDIGYWFPDPVTVNLLVDERSGRWSDLHGAPRPRRQIVGAAKSDSVVDGSLWKAQPSSQERGTDLPPISNRFFTMWIPHGTNPTAALYEYVLLPSTDAAGVAAFVRDPGITVIENTRDASAVRENSMHITGAIFWKDGLHSIGKGSDGKPYITSDQQSAIIVRDTISEISAVISDPTQEFAGTMNVEIAEKGRTVVSNDPMITVVQVSPTIRLLIDFSGAKKAEGKSLGVIIAR